MKKKYILPKTICLASVGVEDLMKQASYTNVGTGEVETDDRGEGEEVDGAAKPYNPWTAWDD